MMETVLQAWIYDGGALHEVIESLDPRPILDRLHEFGFAGSTEFRAELKLCELDAKGRATTVMGTWHVVPGAVPAGCRKARVCVSDDGTTRDLLDFCRDLAVTV